MGSHDLYMLPDILEYNCNIHVLCTKKYVHCCNVGIIHLDFEKCRNMKAYLGPLLAISLTGIVHNYWEHS